MMTHFKDLIKKISTSSNKNWEDLFNVGHNTLWMSGRLSTSGCWVSEAGSRLATTFSLSLQLIFTNLLVLYILTSNN